MNNLIILGSGESALASALLAKKQQIAHIFLSDLHIIAAETKAQLKEKGISYEEGGHTLPTLTPESLIIKSPGIPDTAPVILRCKEVGARVISEIEFAAHFATEPLIGITGSNGKTTTTTLISHLLTALGYHAPACGNIGKSLARVVLESTPEATPDFAVLELSSFQLDGMEQSHIHIALLLNITPDHLDRYQYKLELYADAKGRIFQNQESTDYAIINLDDPITTKLLARRTPSPATTYTFSCQNPSATAYYDSKQQCITLQGVPHRFDFAQLPLKGTHNAQNAMAALLALLALKVDFQEAHTIHLITQALQSFHGIKHRMQPLGTWRGIHFINDSKGTNMDSTTHALAAMPDGKTILLIGGTDKGNDYATLRPLVQAKCKALIYLTTDSQKLHAAFDQLPIPHTDALSMQEAFDALQAFPLEAGDHVLLSPACASFDLFKNYEDRGDQFIQHFHRLTN